MIRENYKKIKNLPGGKFGLFENTSTKKQRTLPLSMADRNGNASVQRNNKWAYNGEIPETPGSGVGVQQEVKAETYDLLRNAIENLKKTGKHVDNCGNCEFECRNVCQRCQSKTIRDNVQCHDCFWENRYKVIYDHECRMIYSCQSCQACQKESCQKQCSQCYRPHYDCSGVSNHCC